MNSTDLFLLSRQLMKLSEEGLPRKAGNRNARLVLVDVGAHPGSSISEITARTGFPQSQISTLVNRLRDYGLVRTEIDGGDRRRTLVFMVPEATEAARRRVTTTIDAAIARALGTTDPSAVAEVVEALELLARRLGVEGVQAVARASS